MAGTVFTSTVARTLKNTLNVIVDDKSDGVEKGLVYKKWCDESKMTDAYEDDLEMAGPGLASEKAEGTEIALGTMREGYMTRYLARTFAMKMIITEEAMEDCKYKEAINLAKRLKRSMAKTMDIDATAMLMRAFNSSYVGGDGQPLCSSSHTLAHGGTFSNQLATPLSPSRMAVIVATTQMRLYPGHDGITEGVEPKAVLCPVAQWAVWRGILGSEYAPEAGEFNEINVVNKDLSLELIPIKYWSNTTTNWIMKTDAENGLQMRIRRKMSGRAWVDEDNMVMKHAQSARWARGWSDPRCVLGSNA
jgi:hypothetical protein